MQPTITQTTDKIEINGKEINGFPIGKKHQTITITAKGLFVNGYEYKNGTWKRTLRALWHLWF